VAVDIIMPLIVAVACFIGMFIALAVFVIAVDGEGR
jgi:hypothetical protein